VFLNVRIVGNEAIQLSRVKFKDQNASNAMVSTSQKTTMNSDGTARRTTRLTHQGWKQRRGSHCNDLKLELRLQLRQSAEEV